MSIPNVRFIEMSTTPSSSTYAQECEYASTQQGLALHQCIQTSETRLQSNGALLDGLLHGLPGFSLSIPLPSGGNYDAHLDTEGEQVYRVYSKKDAETSGQTIDFFYTRAPLSLSTEGHDLKSLVFTKLEAKPDQDYTKVGEFNYFKEGSKSRNVSIMSSRSLSEYVSLGLAGASQPLKITFSLTKPHASVEESLRNTTYPFQCEPKLNYRFYVKTEDLGQKDITEIFYRTAPVSTPNLVNSLGKLHQTLVAELLA